MNEKIYIKEFIEIVKKNRNSIAIIMSISILSLVTVTFFISKTFKSEFEVNIYSQYFNNSLISELIPGINSSTEMTQTVDAMIKELMNDKFIDDLGAEFKLYPTKMDDVELARQRQYLRDKFETFTAGGTAYHIAFIHNDPKITFEVSKKLLESVRSYFIETRITNIELAQQTILKKLESANVAKPFTESGAESSGVSTKSPAVLQAEIVKINQEISSLKMQFNAQHPSIVKLQQRKAMIEKWLVDLKGNSETPKKNKEEVADSNYSPLLMSNDKETSKTITSKLYSNLNNINIALDIERKNVSNYVAVTKMPQFPTAALFPKKRIFASLGFMIGLIFSFLYVFYKEIMKEDSKDKAISLAKESDSKFFGTMPFVDEVNLMAKGKVQISYRKTEVRIEYNNDKIDHKY